MWQQVLVGAQSSPARIRQKRALIEFFLVIRLWTSMLHYLIKQSTPENKKSLQRDCGVERLWGAVKTTSLFEYAFVQVAPRVAPTGDRRGSQQMRVLRTEERSGLLFLALPGRLFLLLLLLLLLPVGNA